VKQKLAILLWATTPERPDLCAAPFVYASVAAAMDAEVEIHFAGPACDLLVAGVASAAVTAGGKNIYSFMREAAALDVRFLACAMGLARYKAAGRRFIPELAGEAGASAFVERSLDPEWATLVF